MTANRSELHQRWAQERRAAHTARQRTDVEGEWFIHPDGRVEAIHAKGDTALRGTASDLLLALYKRIPFERLDIIGDEALARQFAAAIQTD